MGRVLQQFEVLFRKQRFRRFVRDHPPRGFKHFTIMDVHFLKLKGARFDQGQSVVEFLAVEIAPAHVRLHQADAGRKFRIVAVVVQHILKLSHAAAVHFSANDDRGVIDSTVVRNELKGGSWLGGFGGCHSTSYQPMSARSWHYILPWIFRWWPYCKVLAPSTLVRKMQTHGRRIAKLYEEPT